MERLTSLSAFVQEKIEKKSTSVRDVPFDPTFVETRLNNKRSAKVLDRDASTFTVRFGDTGDGTKAANEVLCQSQTN